MDLFDLWNRTLYWLLYTGPIILTIFLQGYRVSAEQQISAALLADKLTERPDLEMLRDAALSIYNQYLSEKVSADI